MSSHWLLVILSLSMLAIRGARSPDINASTSCWYSFPPDFCPDWSPTTMIRLRIVGRRDVTVSHVRRNSVPDWLSSSILRRELALDSVKNCTSRRIHKRCIHCGFCAIVVPIVRVYSILPDWEKSQTCRSGQTRDIRDSREDTCLWNNTSTARNIADSSTTSGWITSPEQKRDKYWSNIPTVYTLLSIRKMYLERSLFCYHRNMKMFLNTCLRLIKRISGWVFLLVVFVGFLVVCLSLWIQTYYTQSSIISFVTPINNGIITINGSADIIKKSIGIPAWWWVYDLHIRFPHEQTLVCDGWCLPAHVPSGSYTIRTTNWTGYHDWNGKIDILRNTIGSITLPLKKIFPITPITLSEIQKQSQQIQQATQERFPGAQNIDINPFDHIATFQESNGQWNIYQHKTQTRTNLLIQAQNVQSIKQINQHLFSMRIDGVYITIDTRNQETLAYEDVIDATGPYTLHANGDLFENEQLLTQDLWIQALYMWQDELVLQRWGSYFHIDLETSKK